MRDPLASAAIMSAILHGARPRILLTPAALALLNGCAAYAWRLAPSVVDSPQANVAAFQTPDSVASAADATVTVWTRSGGCTRQGRAELNTGNNLATIHLYDSVLVRAPSNSLCPEVLRHTRHVFHIQFSQPGTAIIRVIGRDTIEHAVVVR